MFEEKTIDEKLKDLANSILGRVQSDEEGESEESDGVAGAEEKALEPSGEEDNDAESASPSVSSPELVEILERVSANLDEREKQVTDLTETVRLLIQAAPSVPNKEAESAKASAAPETSFNPFGQLDLKR